MNDDDPEQLLEALKAEHRRLDEEVALQERSGNVDPLDLARLKKAKLQLKDRIEALSDEINPDIIA